MRVFYGSCLITKASQSGVTIRSFINTCRSENESLGVALTDIKKKFPESDGYSYQGLMVYELDDMRTLEAIADRFVELVEQGKLK